MTPDEIKYMQAEQQFLMNSLEDLDAERCSGDIAEADYLALQDQYIARLAGVSRRLGSATDQALNDGHEPTTHLGDSPCEKAADTVAMDPSLKSWAVRSQALKSLLVMLGIVAVAAIAGVMVAQSSGFRSPSDAISGGIRGSSVGLLREAATLTREGRWDEAIEVYGEVLALSPANVEALAYRGWLRYRLGEDLAGLADIDDAIAIDLDYPDAHVFRAIVLVRSDQVDLADRFDQAAREVSILNSLEVPEQIASLVSAFELARTITAGQIVELFGDGSPVDLALIDASLSEIAQAAVAVESQNPVLSVRVYSAVLVQDPDQLVALVGKGRRLGADPDLVAASSELGTAGLELLDQAVELAPEAVEIRLYRALALALQGEQSLASQDLAGLDPSGLDAELMDLYSNVERAIENPG